MQQRGVYDISVTKYILTTDDNLPTSHLENFKWRYLRNGSSDPQAASGGVN